MADSIDFSFSTSLPDNITISKEELNNRLQMTIQNKINNQEIDNSDLPPEVNEYIDRIIQLLFLERDRYNLINSDTYNTAEQFLKQLNAEQLLNLQTSRQLVSNQLIGNNLLSGESKAYVISTPPINNIINNYVHNPPAKTMARKKFVLDDTCNKTIVNKIPLWPRTKLECIDTNNTKQELDERYKAELLLHKHLSNHANNTKKFKWKRANTSVLHKRGSVSNNIENNQCNKEIKTYSTRQSNIPGNPIFISYNERVPYIKKQNVVRVNTNIGHNYNNYTMGVLR